MENAMRKKNWKKVEVCINLERKKKKEKKSKRIILHPEEQNFCNKIFENIFLSKIRPSKSVSFNLPLILLFYSEPFWPISIFKMR